MQDEAPVQLRGGGGGTGWVLPSPPNWGGWRGTAEAVTPIPARAQPRSPPPKGEGPPPPQLPVLGTAGDPIPMGGIWGGVPPHPTPQPPLPPGITTKGRLSPGIGGHTQSVRGGGMDTSGGGHRGGCDPGGRGEGAAALLAGHHRIAAKPARKEQGGGGSGCERRPPHCYRGTLILPGLPPQKKPPTPSS